MLRLVNVLILMLNMSRSVLISTSHLCLI